MSDVVTGRSTRVLTELNAGTARAGLLRRGALLSVAVDKAATRVFAGGVDGVLRIWDFERGELLYSLHAGEEFLIASIQLDLTHGRLLVWALEESLSGAGCEVIVWPTKRDDMGMYADALQQLTK